MGLWEPSYGCIIIPKSNQVNISLCPSATNDLLNIQNLTANDGLYVSLKVKPRNALINL